MGATSKESTLMSRTPASPSQEVVSYGTSQLDLDLSSGFA
jgi:hypothetical protein